MEERMEFLSKGSSSTVQSILSSFKMGLFQISNADHNRPQRILNFAL